MDVGSGEVESGLISSSIWMPLPSRIEGTRLDERGRKRKLTSVRMQDYVQDVLESGATHIGRTFALK